MQREEWRGLDGEWLRVDLEQSNSTYFVEFYTN